MTGETESNPLADPPVIFGELEKSWGWLLLLGIVFILLGSLGLYMSFLLTGVGVVFFGALLIAAGALQLLDAIKCRGWKAVAWHVLIALLYVAAGLATVLHPGLAAVSLTLVIAYALIAIGVMRVFMAFQVRPASGWGWPLLAGVVSLVLGGLILAQWPASGLWVIGLFIAIELIVHGWSYLFIAFAARGAGKRRRAAGRAQPA